MDQEIDLLRPDITQALREAGVSEKQIGPAQDAIARKFADYFEVRQQFYEHEFKHAIKVIGETSAALAAADRLAQAMMTGNLVGDFAKSRARAVSSMIRESIKVD